MGRNPDSGNSEPVAPRADSNGFVNRWSPVQSGSPAPSSENSVTIEEWRPCGATSYEVSNLGRVRRGERVLRNRPHPRGYRIVDLSEGGKAVSKTVHRLVAEAFLGPALGRQVNHRSGDKADNRDANLEWCSAGDNLRHAYEARLRMPTRGPRKVAGGAA